MKSQQTSARRVLLKSILVGSGAATTAGALPATWIKPAVDSVLLPAHAQTSLIDGQFGGSGVSVQVADTAPVFDVLMAKAYAGGINPATQLDICALVSSNEVVDLVVRFNQTGDVAIFGAPGLPVEIPGTVGLDVSTSSNVTSGTIQFDGPGNNGLAGRVTLGDGGAPYTYPFDITPGTCPVVAVGP